MLNKLLWSKQKVGRLWMAMLGTILGLFLLLVSIQTYFDIQTLIDTDDSNFVIINKRVGILNMIGGASRFDKEDLSDLENQSFVKQYAPFSASQFEVLAVVPSIGFRSEFFFEAVPDQYLDELPSKFKWQTGNKTLPIILSRDYLSLYNFGFAPTRGMPALTKSTIKKVAFQIRITSSDGMTDYYRGKVVGFSDRINSILVPKTFLDWANNLYGNGSVNPAKLMVEVNNPYSQDFRNYIEENNYEFSSGKLIGDKVGNILGISTGVIAFIGGLIMILALLVFLLNYRLMITAASNDIQLLLQLGYQHQKISQTLINRFIILLTITIGVALFLIAVTRWIAVDWLFDQGFELPEQFNLVTYGVAFVAFLLLFVLNIWAIRRNVVQLA